MIIKDTVLQSERQRIAQFLEDLGLTYEDNVDRTIYVEEDGKVIATVSAGGHIIKCLAVSPEHRNENLAVALVSEMIKRLHGSGYYYYQVFTKPEYREVFINLGFSLLVQTEKFAVLEGGDGNIRSTIRKMWVQMKFSLGIDERDRDSDVACVVINGNPFTNGHLKLVERAALNHKYVLVFILEEEGSYFTFKERYAMAYLALKPHFNVLVLPSSKYIISKYTFPSYFLKTADETTAEYAKYDALIFNKYFIPLLGIKKRYVGSETSAYMRIYNQTLGEVLGERLEIVPRFEDDGKVISAGKVRALIEEGRYNEAMRFIPRNNYSLLRGMILSKHE